MKHEAQSSAPLVILYMEALFQMKRLDDVRRVALRQRQTLEDAADLAIEAREAVTLWVGAAA